MIHHEIGALLPLSDPHLQHQRFVFVSDSQDIAACLECSDTHGNPDHVTGVLAHAEDGDYVEMWVTSWSRPWNLDAIYECVTRPTDMEFAELAASELAESEFADDEGTE